MWVATVVADMRLCVLSYICMLNMRRMYRSGANMIYMICVSWHGLENPVSIDVCACSPKN